MTTEAELTQAGGKVVESWRALVAPFSGEVRTANTLTSGLVAHVLGRARRVTVTWMTHVVAIVTVLALLAVQALVSRSTNALASLLVAVQVEATLAIALALGAVGKPVVPVHALVTVRT